MEIVGTLFATMMAGGTAAAGTAAAAGGTAAAAGAAATAAATSSTLLTVLQGVGTAFTALATMGAASASASEMKAAAQEEEFRSRDEFIRGEQETARLSKELALTLGRQKVAFAAGGVDLGSQAVGVARENAIDDAERELSFARNDAWRAGLARRRTAVNLRRRANSTMTAGYLSAGGEVAKFGAEAFDRG